jgi:hypothetical protein
MTLDGSYIYIYLYICNYVHIYIYWNHHLSSFFQCLLIQLANPIFWFTSYLIYSNIICPCKVRENHVAPPSFLPTPWQHFGTFLRYQKASEACEDRRSLLKETRNVQFKVPPRWVSRAGPWDRGDSWRFMEIPGGAWYNQEKKRVWWRVNQKTQRGELGWNTWGSKL